ncbi:Peptidyl-prolyl cis-trans isomerase [Minicystis rosea]|nr:Peptidyl-prolyl cis-trans isomerase [Minicystis rosea]
MPLLHAFAEIVARAAGLLALAAAPPLFSPEPSPPANLILEALVAAVALAAVVIGAVRFHRQIATRTALVGAALLVVAVIAALVSAALFRGSSGPLGRGLLWVAVPLWAGLAVIAGVVAERRFAPSFPRKALVASVMGLGVVLLATQVGWLFAPDQMWWQALRKDGGNSVAAEAIIKRRLRTRSFPAAVEILDRCLVASPGSCACLARRASVGVLMGAAEQALKDGREAVAACPNDPSAVTALIAALSFHGDSVEAEAAARDAIGKHDDPRYHYALAIAYDRQGRRPEALDEAKKAVDGGAGRDAMLLLGALAIQAGDLETAQKALAPLVAVDPDDAEAQYDLALIADRRDDYNKARQGYLAALHAAPTMIDARYNVALLALRHQVVDEAKHHAQRFSQAAPADPRNARLAALIAASERK